MIMDTTVTSPAQDRIMPVAQVVFIRFLERWARTPNRRPRDPNIRARMTVQPVVIASRPHTADAIEKVCPYGLWVGWL